MEFNLLAFLRALILPPASLIVLLALGLVLYRRRPHAAQAAVLAGLVLLYVLSTRIGVSMLVAPLERMAPPVTAARGTGAQAIVVLAAGRVANAPEYGGMEQPDYVALARLRYAVRLHRETGLPILVSGGNGTEDGRFKPKAFAMARALREEFAVPVQWTEPASENTAQNAEFSARLLQKENIRRILLVTDAMHMPRSVMAFERNGMVVVAAPTVYFSSGRFTWMHLVPTVENLRRTYYALYEWIGLAWYVLQYASVDKQPGARAPT